jgi:hypothetical protein
MIVSIENIQASINHHWIMFPRYYNEKDTVRCCQFCKIWAPLTFIIGALCFFIVFQLENIVGCTIIVYCNLS